MRPAPARPASSPAPAARAGAALVTALLVTGVLMLLGVGFLNLSATEVQIAANERQADQALFVAEAGLAQAVRDLVYDLNFKQAAGIRPSWWYNADAGEPAGRVLNAPPRLAWEEVSRRPVPGPALALDLTQAGRAAPPPPQYLDSHRRRGGKLDWFAQPWVRVPYPNTTLGKPDRGTLGSYTVDLLSESGSPNRIYVRVAGETAQGRARVVLRGELEAADLSPWNTAAYSGAPLHGGTPVPGRFILRGSAYVRGTAALGGSAHQYNNYSDGTGSSAPDAILVGKLPPLPDGSLRGALRVRGDLSLSGASSIGLPEEGSDAVKQTIEGVYVTGSTSAPAGAVHADRLGGRVPDVPPPSLLDYHTRLDAQAGTARAREAAGRTEAERAMTLYREDAGGAILNDATASILGIEKEGGCFRINHSTPSFVLGNPGNRVIYDQAAAVLTFDGAGPRGDGVLAFVDGCLKVHLRGSLQYRNTGTLVVNGEVRLDGDRGGGALYAADTYPVPHSLGVIARDDITFDGSPGSRYLGAFFAGGRIRVRGEIMLGGALVAADELRLEHATHLYQVPALRSNLPPGMPGGGARWMLTAFSWREMLEQ